MHPWERISEIQSIKEMTTRVKKTALGKRKCEDQLMVHLSTLDYYEGPKRVPGSQLMKRRIWLRHALQS